jgi:DNA-binding IclR family transcriptional regulator
MKSDDTRRATHLSLERGLALLEAVAFNGRASLAEASRRTGLNRSTAHHLLQALVSLDYLRQDPESRSYQLGVRPLLLTGRTWSPEQIARIGEPFLAELVRRGGENASLAVYRDGVVTLVAKREHDGPVRVVQNLGAQRPIHCTAVAKAILPWLPRAELAGLLDRARFERYTPKTVTARAAFEAHLRRIRGAGYAIDDEEHLEGIRCIAAPVFGPADQVIASMCAVGPKSRMTHQKLRELRVLILELARALSEQLGWQPPDGITRANGSAGPGRSADRADRRRTGKRL